jgi:hypothetical protein
MEREDGAIYSNCFDVGRLIILQQSNGMPRYYITNAMINQDDEAFYNNQLDED